jgi:hypothetical protein
MPRGKNKYFCLFAISVGILAVLSTITSELQSTVNPTDSQMFAFRIRNEPPGSLWLATPRQYITKLTSVTERRSICSEIISPALRWSRGSSVGIAAATSCTASTPDSVQTNSGVNPTSYSMDTGGFFFEGKQPERDSDHSPQSSAAVKNGGVMPPLPHTSFWCHNY